MTVNEHRAGVDGATYRAAIGRFATGVGVITTVHDGARYAMTTNAVTSVSLDPVLLLACFKEDSDTRTAVARSGRFALNILDARDGIVLSQRFARKRAGDDDDQLAGVDVEEGPGGLPLLTASLSQFVCDVERTVTAGDHDVVIGEVREVRHLCEKRADSEPIVFYAGRYWKLVPAAEVSTFP